MKDFLCAHVHIIKWVHRASDIVKLPTNHSFVWWEVSLETITHFFCHPRIVVCTKICCWNHASIVSSFCYPLAFSFFSKIILVNKTGRGVRVFSKYTLWLNEIVMQSHICFCNTTDCFYLSVNRSTKYSKLSCKNTKRVFDNAVGSCKTIIKNSFQYHVHYEGKASAYIPSFERHHQPQKHMDNNFRRMTYHLMEQVH